MLESIASFDISMMGSNDINPRRQIWRNTAQKIVDENLSMNNPDEVEKLTVLKAGIKWFDMIDAEWKDIYGALFDESPTFDVPASEKIKIDKDIHRTFGLFTRNTPLLR